MTRDEQRTAFLASIAATPQDYARRREYTDWLDEHDEPEEADRQRKFEAAERWLRDFAAQCGEHCENYDEVYDELYRQVGNLHYNDPRREAAFEWAEQERRYRPVSYDDVVQAGITFVEADGCEWFTQMGSQQARDLAEGDVLRQYWECWSIVTGRPLPDGKLAAASPFSCSC